MGRREAASSEWLSKIAIAIVVGFIVNGFLEQAKRPTKRAPGKIIPSVVPAGLPAFPAGWEPFLPLKPAVSQRAAEVLFTLWRQGEGATLTEETDGQWVTYQAQIHQEGTARKKGVGAWRVKAGLHGATA
jgi:hypothetical protein